MMLHILLLGGSSEVARYVPCENHGSCWFCFFVTSWLLENVMSSLTRFKREGSFCPAIKQCLILLHAQVSAAVIYYVSLITC